MMVLDCREERQGGWRTRQQEGGMVATRFEGNLEPINLGNFYDKKQTSQLFELVGCAMHLCLRLIPLIGPIASDSFFRLF